MRTTVNVYSRVSRFADQYLECIFRLPCVELEDTDALYNGYPLYNVSLDQEEYTYSISFVRARLDKIGDDDITVFVFDKHEDLVNELKHLSSLNGEVYLVNVGDNSYHVGNYHMENLSDPRCGRALLENVFSPLDDVVLKPRLRDVLLAEFDARSDTDSYDKIFYKIKAEKLRAAYDKLNPRTQESNPNDLIARLLGFKPGRDVAPTYVQEPSIPRTISDILDTVFKDSPAPVNNTDSTKKRPLSKTAVAESLRDMPPLETPRSEPSTPQNINDCLAEIFGSSSGVSRYLTPPENPKSSTSEYMDIFAPVLGLLTSSVFANPTKQDYLRVLTEITDILKNKN